MYTNAILAFALAALSGLAAANPTPNPDVGGALTPPPTGTADGLYLVDLNDDGTSHYKLISPASAKDKRSDLSSSADTLVSRAATGAYCSNHGINASDLNNAQNAFISMCGDGYWFSSRAIALVRGSAIVYGCNYGNGQTCHAGDVASFLGSIDSKCGKAAAGWYSKNEWKASYGRETNPAGYC